MPPTEVIELAPSEPVEYGPMVPEGFKEPAPRPPEPKPKRVAPPKPEPEPEPDPEPEPEPEPEPDPPPRAMATAPRGFWIQLGAFRQRDGAESFPRRVADELDWLSPMLAVFEDAPLFRLQAGPYASREEAREGAERVREALQLVPVIVQRR